MFNVSRHKIIRPHQLLPFSDLTLNLFLGLLK